MSEFNRFLAAAGLGLALAAAPLAAEEDAPAARPAASWSHDRSGLVLPASIAGFARGETRQYDEGGYNVGVTLRDAASDTVATLFVYRAAPALVAIWADRAAAAMFANPKLGEVDAAAVRFARFTPPGGAGELSGLMVVAPVKGELVATGLALYAHDDWLVKLRMSSSTLDMTALEARMKDFVAALAFPAARTAAPPYADLAACARALDAGKGAKLVRLDMMGSILIGAAIGAAQEQDEKKRPGDDPARVWCRDPGSGPQYGIYRSEGHENTYLVALGDTGTSLSVGPYDLGTLMRPGRGFLVTRSDGVTMQVYPPFDRLPQPAQVLGLLGKVGPVYSAGLLAENKGATLTVPGK